METKPRFRPSLRQYRDIEHQLNVANGHIELGTKQLSDLQRKHDIQEAANKELTKQRTEWINDNSKWRAEYMAQELISKDLMVRRSANLLEIANLNRTAAMGFCLAIVAIMASAYQIANALQSL
jgi:hypothetical protein